MRKNKPIIEIEITDSKYPSIGLATYHDKPMEAKHTFPGQTILGRHLKYKRGIGQVMVLEKSKKAPWEIEPPCPHYESCGGCTSQEAPYEKQMEMLSKDVLALLESNGIEIGHYNGIDPSPSQYHYRNKMEYTFGDETKGGPLALGMHYKNKKNSIITTDHCLIVPEDFNTILKATLDYFTEKDLPYYRVMARTGILRNLIIRHATSSKELMVILVTTSSPQVDAKEWAKVMESLSLNENLVSLYHIQNDSLQDAVVPEKIIHLSGKTEITETLLGTKFKITPMSFFQTNSKGAETIYSEVIRMAGNLKEKEVFDLYCGTGTIGNLVAPYAKFVTGVEIIQEAADIANENAELNGNTNTNFIAGDVKDVLENLVKKPDLIILDPPRSGLHPKALAYALAFNAPEIIYISCNPKTLAEDLKIMSKSYKIKELTLIDNFPNTSHVEALVLMTRE